MALGPELFVNGNFDTNLVGWTTTGQWAWDSGRALGGTDSILVQDLNLELGKTYLFSFDFQPNLVVDPVGHYDFNFGLGISTSNHVKYLSGINTGVQHASFNFTVVIGDFDGPTVTTGLDTSLYGLYVDNMSIRENPGSLYLQITQMVGSETLGEVQTLNAGKSDDETEINYELETQDLEFGNRSHLKKMADKIIVFSKDAGESQLAVKEDGGNYQSIPVSLIDRVNIEQNFNAEGHFMNVKWSGNSSTVSPVLEGLKLTDIFDFGMTDK